VIDKAKWEEKIKKLSSAFKPYKEILSSRVNFFFINNTIYYTTSEGTQLQYPAQIACLSVGAETQANDGEPVSDFLSYYAQTPDDLPTVDKVTTDIQNMIKNIQDLQKAPVIEDSYAGPVVFEGEAAAELFVSLFSSEGLIASREPVSMFAGPSIGAGRFENKMNQRICPANISIFSTPKIKTFNNVQLIGSFDVDAEGVAPKDKLVLVDKGILKTLLNDRIPTNKVKESNGHCRIDLFRGATEKAPGIINISYDGGKTAKSLAKTAEKEARKNSLEYYYIIRKLDKNAAMPLSGGNMSVSRPIAIYKVSVKTGVEQLVRSAFISEFEAGDFKKIIGGAKEQFIYNTIFTDGAGGYPASFIVPQSIVFSEITIEKDKGTRPQKPIVPNPAGSL
jgi:urease gamma subunit